MNVPTKSRHQPAEQQSRAPAPEATVIRLPFSPLRRTVEDINTAILATVRAGAGGYFNIAERRTALKEKSGWIADFDHFRRLCIGDMRQAFDESRREGKRITHHRKQTWDILFGYFARRAGIKRDVRITALDREGNYACTLVDKDDDEEKTWEKFLRLGQRFSILATQLEAAHRISQTKKPRDAQVKSSMR